MTTFVADYRPVFLVVTFAFLGLAFYLTYRSANRSRMMKFNKVMLWTATVVAIVFLFFPQAMTKLTASDNGFTRDMDQTVLTIEGMT